MFCRWYENTSSPYAGAGSPTQQNPLRRFAGRRGFCLWGQAMSLVAFRIFVKEPEFNPD